MLNRMLADKRDALRAVDLESRLAAFRQDIAAAEPVRSLKRNLAGRNRVAIIAEIKRRSPARGRLIAHLPIAETVHAYERGGAAAISVLTEEHFFGGSIEDLRETRRSTRLPVLRKDLILEEFQVWESRANGADAILLIARILTPEQLQRLCTVARQIGLEVLIEVHDQVEIETALTVNPEMIGINNRDLSTFAVDLETTKRLRPLIPMGVICVSESGIQCPEDVDRLAEWNVDAALVGEALIVSPDREAKVRELAGGNRDQD